MGTAITTIIFVIIIIIVKKMTNSTCLLLQLIWGRSQVWKEGPGMACSYKLDQVVTGSMTDSTMNRRLYRTLRLLETDRCNPKPTEMGVGSEERSGERQTKV